MPPKNKSIKNDAAWKHWCHLCAAKDTQILPTIKSEEKTLKVEEEGAHIAEMLQRVFGMEVEHLSLEETQLLCQQCRQRLLELHAFVQHVERVQAMFSDLKALEKTRKKTKDWSAVYKRFDFIACLSDDQVSIEPPKTVQEDADVVDEQPVPIEMIEIQKNDINIDDQPMTLDIMESKLPLDSLKIEEELTSLDIKPEEHSNSETDSKHNEYTENDLSKDGTWSDTSSEPMKKTRRKRIKTRTKCQNPKPEHICSKCKLGYMSFSRYRRHMQLKHKQNIAPQHHCSECSSCFTTALKLEAHQKTHLPLDIKKTFECKDCSKKFTTPYVLENHISAVHNNAKPYICEECGLALKSVSSLKTHMMRHSDERPFKCELCGKTFKHYPGLKRHKEAHGSQKYVCPTCGFEVNTRSSLKRHMIIHLDVKLYKCEFCVQQFKRAEGYKHHLVLHSGLKPYICNFCNRSFAHGSNCRSHLKKSHPKELAELEQKQGRNAAGFTNNAPKMKQLMAITKNANNIHHVHSKKINFSNKSQEKN